MALEKVEPIVDQLVAMAKKNELAYPNAAIVLYTLAACIEGRTDDILAVVAQNIANENVEQIRATLSEKKVH